MSLTCYARAMGKQAVETNQAPSAIGPYSQAAVASGSRMVFCSGQIPLDAVSGEIVGTDDIQAATTQVMRNLAAVLKAAGADWADVVKTTIFLTDLGDFAAVNEVYRGYFASTPPARACVQVSALPKGVRVEIDAIAVLP